MADDNSKRANHELVGRALNGNFREQLVGFVAQSLSKFYRNDWWKLGVFEKLNAEQRRRLPREGNYETFTDSMDLQLCFDLIRVHRSMIFRQKLTARQFIWLSELRDIRNDWAHTQIEKFDDSYVERALDTMARVCGLLDEDTTIELWSQLRKFREQKYLPADDAFEEEDENAFFKRQGDFISWRDVMQPNPDVREGNYKIAEFAADLAQVVAGTSPQIEYQDATEFFARTYMTEGMRRLLKEAIYRLVYGNGEPVIEVKTAFGGGKTHSMMALYHLFNRKYRLTEVDESVRQLLLEAQIRAELPKDICIAAAVGTDLNTEKAKDIPELDGVQTHTLMGEICVQLARSANKIELYEKYIRLNDERGVSPGANTLREFLNACGRCLILLDELVSYGKKLHGVERSTRFDNFTTFLQEISEAVRTSDHSILVTSLPQSEIEIGLGDGGREVLATIEHYFGRLQAVWSPVEAQESFEIVRRRLFMPCRRENLRDEVCKTFAKMYRGSQSPFPIETKEARYAERLRACYPIHPQVFDLLYGKWATIENFQKTRGVLRFMAEVIHTLWREADQNPMIMSGSIPLFMSDVREELIRYISSNANWTNIITSEIDGADSAPRKLESSEKMANMQAARRMTRTLFLGSAPTARGQNVRGLTEPEIMLGALMPQDRKNLTIFKNILSKLRSKLTYLYSNETHSWFDGRQTLRKVAEALEENIADKDVEYDIEDRLDNEFNVMGYFNRKYITTRAEDIPELSDVCLVILPPSCPFDHRTGEECVAFTVAEDILSRLRDEVPRRNKNMLLFLAGERPGFEALKKLVRRNRAWTRLYDEREERNFDYKQIEEVEKNLNDLAEKIRVQISLTYVRMMEPTVLASDMRRIIWKDSKLQDVKFNNIKLMSEYMNGNGALIREMKAGVLQNYLERYCFKNEPRITIGRLWQQLTEYIYSPRLYNQRVLLDAIHVGVRGGFFGLADEYNDETDEYDHLIIGEPPDIQANDQLLVSAVEAAARLEEPEIVEDTTEEPIEEEPEELPEPLPTGFSMTLELNAERMSKDVDKMMNEIVDTLKLLPNLELSIEMNIRSRAADGIPDDIRSALEENCRQLKTKFFRFTL